MNRPTIQSHAAINNALLLLPCLLPAISRFLQHGLSKPAGLVSDLALGCLFFAILRWSPHWCRFLFLPCWAFWHLAAHELYVTIQRLPVAQDMQFLFDSTFLTSSTAGFHLSAPLYSMFLIATILPPLFLALHRPGHSWPLCSGIIGLILLVLHQPINHAHLDQSIEARYNPLHWLLVDGFAATSTTPLVQEDGVTLPAGLQFVDLQGRRLLPPTTSRNVLIITLEGIPGLYLPTVRRAMGVAASAQEMTGLEESSAGAMLVPDFVVHGHQTIRGLYALHCGDFSKLSSETSKAIELQLAQERADQCLPAQLAAHGWQTHFLQGAPLQFMNKDKAMPSMGFDEVHGIEYFSERSNQDFIWGPDDHDFFAGARKYITTLQQQKKEQPWLLSLLTVGTHQPFAASDAAVAQYGSRKEAAVAELDQAVSDFLKWLRQQHVLDNTLVVITSDESHGAAGPDWFSSWGLGIILSPDNHDLLPRLKQGTYGLVDIEASILDYFDLPMPPSIRGRSLFRDYSANREMISYTGGKLRLQTSQDGLLECSGNANCLRYPNTTILAPRPTPVQLESNEETRRIYAVANQLNRSILGHNNRRILQFGDGQTRKLPEKLRNEWTDNLIGAQYLNFPEGSTVQVDIQLKAVSAPDSGLQLRLVLRQYEQEVTNIERPHFPLLHPGESCRLSFAFDNPTPRQAFSFHLVGEGKDAEIKIDKFQLTVTSDAS